MIRDWILRLCAAAAMLAGGYWFFRGAPTSSVYPIDIATAEARLRRMTFDEGMLGGMRLRLSSADADAGRALRWQIRMTDSKRAPETVCAVALIEEKPDRTRTELACLPEPDDRKPEVAARAGELVELVMAEHVDATLGNRPFDHERMGKAVYAFALATRPLVAREMSAAGDAQTDTVPR